MKSLTPIALLLAAAATSPAQTAYNGDFMGGDTNLVQADTLSDQWVYDQVNVLGPRVTTIWGNFIIYQQYAASSHGLKYQVRTGITPGHGGTLVASGTVMNLQQTPIGRSTQNGFYREIQLYGTVELNLAPGVYWLGLQNDEGTNPPAGWTSFLTQTAGGNNGPATDPNPPPQNSSLNASGFVTGAEGGNWIALGHDYSVGVVSEGAAVCYANCDGSTAAPILNVNDFVCFQSRFAAGDSYANCDGSTAPPVLNVNDFVCFQSSFAAGCP